MLRSLAVVVLVVLPMSAWSQAYLLMAEEPGCVWCAKWNREIAHIYPNTAEGRSAPLKRFDLRRDSPDVTFARRVHYTPTFILVNDGEEIARIEGYPGEEFFWGLLSRMMERAGIPVNEAS